MVLFNGTCFYGVSQGPFLTTVSWLSFHEVQTQMTASQHIYAKLFIKCSVTVAVYLNVGLKGCGGKRLHTCKYGFPFAIPQSKECLDEEGMISVHSQTQRMLHQWSHTIQSYASSGVLPTTSNTQLNTDMSSIWQNAYQKLNLVSTLICQIMLQTHRDTYAPE